MRTDVLSRTRTRRQVQLFDSLVDLFLADGFAGVTLDDLARRLRCSKTTLYALADSKDDLVRAVAVHFFRGATERVEADLAAVHGAADRIRAYLESVGRQLEPASARFMEDLAASPGAREVYRRNTALAAERVRSLIADGVASGELRTVDARFAADLVASQMVRIQQREVASATGLGDARAYRELAALVTHGLTPAPDL